MWEFLRAIKKTPARLRLPEWSWLVLGYSLFTWSTIRMMPVHLPEPDAIVCSLVYLIFALLFRMRTEVVTWGKWILFGVLLGLSSPGAATTGLRTWYGLEYSPDRAVGALLTLLCVIVVMNLRD